MKTPIRTRLTLIYGAVFCASTILLEIGAYAGLKASIDAVIDSELESRLRGVVGFLDEHVARRTLPQLQSEVSIHAALSPELLRIGRVGDGELYRGLSMNSIGKFPSGKAPVFVMNHGATPVRLLAARRRIRNRDYELTLGANYTLPTRILRRFRWLVFLLSPIAFGCAATAAYLVSERALRPVSRLANAARSIGAANLSERLAVPDSEDELKDLAETLNGMLGRIEGAFRHVTQFTANASHELRTPLALIRATAEVALLRRNAVADHYREALHRILREAERNSTLLDDLLRLARADAAEGSLDLQPLEFAPHIEDLCERIMPLALEKNIRLECRAPEGGLWVMGHREHLKRLWLILLDNAIRYTPAGGTIRVAWGPASPDRLACAVSDTGIGISQEDLPHIFERFFRADKARCREEGGAGLGLTLARRIVEAHGATIHVESAPGMGSTFRVVLPMPAQPETVTIPPVKSMVDQSIK